MKYLLWIAVFVLFQSSWPWILLILIPVILQRQVRARSPHMNAYLFAGALLITLSVGEITLRFVGRYRTYMEGNGDFVGRIIRTSYISPFESDEYGWLHVHHRVGGWLGRMIEDDADHTNKEGLYDVDHPLVKTRRCRVLVLGDSFTQGVGSTADSGYVSLLGRKSDSLEMMNAGVAASDPAFELKLLELRMFQYHPDIVIMSVNRSDIDDFVMRGGDERFMPDSTIRFRSGPWWEWAYESSFIVRHIVHGVCGLDRLYMTSAQEGAALALAQRQIAETISAADRECRARHIRFVVNFHPGQNEAESGHMDLDPVMRQAHQSGIEVFDMNEYFRSHGIDHDHAYLYYGPDRHHNNAGYAVFADGLATIL